MKNFRILSVTSPWKADQKKSGSIVKVTDLNSKPLTMVEVVRIFLLA